MDAVEEIDVFQVVYQLKSLIPHFMENVVSCSVNFNILKVKAFWRINYYVNVIKWRINYYVNVIKWRINYYVNVIKWRINYYVNVIKWRINYYVNVIKWRINYYVNVIKWRINYYVNVIKWRINYYVNVIKCVFNVDDSNLFFIFNFRINIAICILLWKIASNAMNNYTQIIYNWRVHNFKMTLG